VLALVLVVRASRKDGGVLRRNHQWGERFLAHEDPYYDPAHGQREHGPYPPSMAWVAAPLAALPLLPARILWASLQVGALVLLYRMLRRRTAELWPALERHVPALYGLALVLASRFLLRDTAGGGGNLIYAALALGSVELALRGRETLAGWPLALSLVLKPNLAPFVLFLGLRKRWRAVASTLGATALLYALPGLYYGPEAYAKLSLRWARDVLHFVELDELHSSALVPDGLPPAEDGMNQDLREAVYRLLRPPGDSGAYDVHVVELSPEAASWVARALELALVAAAAATAWRARGARAEWLSALAFYPLALLCSPITWKAHHVVLLPVFYALLCRALEPERRARWLLGFLLGYWVVCDLLAKEIVGDALRDWLQAASVVAWADIALLAILLALAREREPREA